MPNWCSNSITIEGPADKIRQLWESAQSQQDGGLLEATVPIGDWDYGTAVDTWGTKWDISLEGLEFIDNDQGRAMITGWFDSAWAPPIGAYERYLETNDDVSIEASYYEPGMDFAGFWKDGEEEHMDNLHDEFQLPEDQRSDLYNRLDEEYNLSENYEMWDEDFADE